MKSLRFLIPLLAVSVLAACPASQDEPETPPEPAVENPPPAVVNPVDTPLMPVETPEPVDTTAVADTTA